MKAVRAGALYFALVFALGFLLGTLRTLLVAPALGETRAVLLELPLMLAASFLFCRFLAGRMAVPPAQRPLMGAVFLALLLAAELALGLMMGRPLPTQLADWVRLPGSLGLSAQVAAALFPMVVRR